MRMLKVAAMLIAGVVIVGITVRGQVPGGPLPQFSGDYRIVRGSAGTVRVAEAVGGAYAEWRVSLGQPSHELRMLVAASSADGSFRVWRFEQEPAPAVGHEGIARLEGREFIADFPATTGQAGRFLRERWRLAPDGSLEFDLEASAQGEAPRRVGGFVAVRQYEQPGR